MTKISCIFLDGWMNLPENLFLYIVCNLIQWSRSCKITVHYFVRSALWFLIAQKISWRQQCNNSNCWLLLCSRMINNTYFVPKILASEVNKGNENNFPPLVFSAFSHFIFLIKLIYLSHAKNVLWGTFLWLLTTLSDFPQQVGLPTGFW